MLTGSSHRGFSLTTFALLLGLPVFASTAAFAAEENLPPNIDAGPPVNSCCRVLGEEGVSEQVTHEDGKMEWTCHQGKDGMDGVPNGFRTSWNAGLLPYKVLEDRFRGPIGIWSPWFNRDLPSGAGDYELLPDLVDSKQVCAHPLMIECQTSEGEADWRDSHLVYHCDLAKGGYCINKEQAPGQSCEDFKVRYLCTNIQLSSRPGSHFVP